MSTDTVPVEAPAPAAPAATLFDSIDWKNPVPGVMKIATHLQSLDMMTDAERLTLLQGSLLHVITTSKMGDEEQAAARAFVTTMLPHVVETAVTTLKATAKLHAAEKKAEEILSRQPAIVVKTMEAVLADASKTSWWCFHLGSRK